LPLGASDGRFSRAPLPGAFVGALTLLALLDFGGSSWSGKRPDTETC